jgi:hypothetical protein
MPYQIAPNPRKILATTLTKTASIPAPAPAAPRPSAPVLADKHRVLPGFGRNRPPVSPYDPLFQEISSKKSLGKPFRFRTYEKTTGAVPLRPYFILSISSFIRPNTFSI